MAKITRVTGKIFGETASTSGNDPEIGQFGSAKAGTYNGTGDVATIQGLPAWSNGWIDAVTPTQQFPTLPEMTGVHKVLSYQNAYLLQQGIAEWDSATTYYTNNFCAKNGKIYISQTDSNLNNDPESDTINWHVYETGGANKDLSNLSTTGESRLHALKGYLDEGELLTDAEGLADVTAYAHSTFDGSKFTKTGSPTVTEEGIANGFSDGNYLTHSGINLNSADTWKIRTKFKLTNVSPTIQGICSVDDGTYSIGLIVNDSRLACTAIDNNGTQLIQTSTGNVNISLNTDYWAEFEFDGTKYTGRYSTDGITYTEFMSLTSSTKVHTTSTVRIGRQAGVSDRYFSGRVYLPYTQIYKDGVPVFSGNKTGVDAIKPDNYTVVGSPTISADGVASGFSTTPDKINTGFELNPQDRTVELYFPFTTGNDVTTLQCFANTNNCIYGRVEFGKIRFGYGTGATSDAFIANIDVDNATINTSYVIKLTYDLTTYRIYLSTNNSEFVLKNETTSNNRIKYDTSNPIFSIGLVATANVQPWLGSIDLNLLRFYFDGSLVYQPCLKIPYTLSKTGSKVVDSYYRDRVTDMYNQFGYAPYYTLLEGTNYTIPQGEIYGMIAKQPIQAIMPDYSNAILVDSGVVATEQTYTCPDNGWISCTNLEGVRGEAAVVKINNYTVIETDTVAGSYSHGDSAMFIVKKGDVVSYVFPDSPNADRAKISFIPMKG